MPSGRSRCKDCEPEICRICGRPSRERSGHRALAAPDKQFLLPPPPSRHSSQVSVASRQGSRAPSAASHRSSHSRSGRVQLPDTPLLPSDSVSNIHSRADGPPGPASAVSRTEVMYVSHLTEENLRQANSASGNRERSTQDRMERLVKARPPAIMPPSPPPSLSHGSSRRLEMSWSGTPRLIEWRPSSTVSRHSSTRSSHDRERGRSSHHSRPRRRRSSSSSGSEAAIRPYEPSVVSRATDRTLGSSRSTYSHSRVSSRHE
jgi:hypothetical protein